ncbi:hypothetical protein [Comamonas granuli]|uniref:hypothetical protein n=1 Tax=Comamonas granuli TaxID=290309 RepID=UPI0005A66791|nr:hypothetical protein [Comamonas granuli]
MEAIARNPQEAQRVAAPPSSSAAAAYRRGAEEDSDAGNEPDSSATTVTLSARAQALARAPQAADAREQEQAGTEAMAQLNAQVRRAYLSE